MSQLFFTEGGRFEIRILPEMKLSKCYWNKDGDRHTLTAVLPQILGLYKAVYLRVQPSETKCACKSPCCTCVSGVIQEADQCTCKGGERVSYSQEDWPSFNCGG